MYIQQELYDTHYGVDTIYSKFKLGIENTVQGLFGGRPQ